MSETIDLLLKELKLPVESRCGAVALGLACLFPSLSFDGALGGCPRIPTKSLVGRIPFCPIFMAQP